MIAQGSPEQHQDGFTEIVPVRLNVGRSVIDRFLIASGRLTDGHHPELPGPLPREDWSMVGEVAALASRRIASGVLSVVGLPVRVRPRGLRPIADGSSTEQDLARARNPVTYELFDRRRQAQANAPQEDEVMQRLAAVQQIISNGGFVRVAGADSDLNGQGLTMGQVDTEARIQSGNRMADARRRRAELLAAHAAQAS